MIAEKVSLIYTAYVVRGTTEGPLGFVDWSDNSVAVTLATGERFLIIPGNVGFFVSLSPDDVQYHGATVFAAVNALLTGRLCNVVSLAEYRRSLAR